MDSSRHRLELQDFLRRCRANVTPQELGITVGSRRRLRGLRREEVATLANVSVSWYTALEQGKDVGVSDQVLESIARALHLGPAATRHLKELASAPPADWNVPLVETVSPEILAVLDRFSVPAILIGRRLDRLAWNGVAEAIYGDHGHAGRRSRNILWRMFTDPTLRTYLADWEVSARRQLAEFRASSGRYVDSPWFRAFIEEMNEASPEFREWWSHHEVYEPAIDRLVVLHPTVGRLTFLRQTMFEVIGETGQRLSVHLPDPESDTEGRLSRLVPAPLHAMVAHTTPRQTVHPEDLSMPDDSLAALAESARLEAERLRARVAELEMALAEISHLLRRIRGLPLDVQPHAEGVSAQ